MVMEVGCLTYILMDDDEIIQLALVAISSLACMVSNDAHMQYNKLNILIDDTHIEMHMIWSLTKICTI